MTERLVLQLFQYDRCGVLILAPTGIWYSNQAGGNGCQHPEAEGAFVPLKMHGPPHIGCWDELSEAEADQLDAHFADYRDRCLLSVERTRLAESTEAWVYINVTESPTPDLCELGAYSGPAIFTWGNCD